MKDLVLNKRIEETLLVEQNKFIRNKSQWSKKMEFVLKLYLQVYAKGADLTHYGAGLNRPFGTEVTYLSTAPAQN